MKPNAQTLVVLTQLAGWVRMRAEGHRGGERGDEAEIVLREIERLSESTDEIERVESKECSQSNCEASATHVVFWPGKELYLCDACTDRALGIGVVMGFSVTTRPLRDPTDELDRRIADARPRQATELLGPQFGLSKHAGISVDPNASYDVARNTAEERVRRATVLMVAKVIRGVVDAASARAANTSIITAECDAAVLVALQRFCSDCDVDEVGARDFITDMFVAACSDVGFVMLRWGE